uniref:parathyroid hormone-like n=1 Tax=Doryrhamphus excisus TaxID=161450 RepID=UPI0025AE3317|nr:parathyroid hormone-like [Doryrhamphus excisus]
MALKSVMRTLFLATFYIWHIFTVTEGLPLRKRTVSEVQLMHDRAEVRQVQERRDWLQVRLRGLHTAPAHGPWPWIGFFPGEPISLTAEEIQEALNMFHKLLLSKHS